jgi:hypothetical protein
MMGKHQELRELLFKLLKGNIPTQTVEAKVTSVDKEHRTCELEPTDGSPALYEARLTSVVDDQVNYLVTYPKEGSIVLATVINNDPKDVHVLAIGEVESIEMKIGSMSLFQNAEGHVFNGGGNGGMVITPTLRDELNKTNELVEALVQVINGAPVPEPGNSAPSALQTSLKAAIIGKQLGDYSQIENNKVKH